MLLLVSVCCDSAQALIFLLVSMCCDTAQTLMLLLVSMCSDTAQALVFLLVSVCCDTALTKAGPLFETDKIETLTHVWMKNYSTQQTDKIWKQSSFYICMVFHVMSVSFRSDTFLTSHPVATFWIDQSRVWYFYNLPTLPGNTGIWL